MGPGPETFTGWKDPEATVKKKKKRLRRNREMSGKQGESVLKSSEENTSGLSPNWFLMAMFLPGQ